MRMSKTLILGAGASAPYRFPTGGELKQMLLFPASLSVVRTAGLVDRFGEAVIVNFGREFSDSMLYSIDAFLARRPELAELGKLLLAAVLLDHERNSYVVDPRMDWYSYLWNEVATQKLDDLDLSWLSVVTFNYDRSLEHYLTRAVKSCYDVPWTVAQTVVGKLAIVHVYGSLGSLQVQDDLCIPFGADVNGGNVECAAASLKVIPEHRDGTPSAFDDARRLIAKANRVAVLGLGFDKVNLERLNATETLGSKVLVGLDSVAGRRKWFGTCLGLTAEEATYAANLCGGVDNWRAIDGALFPDNMYPYDSLRLLRETLMLRKD